MRGISVLSVCVATLDVLNTKFFNRASVKVKNVDLNLIKIIFF